MFVDVIRTIVSLEPTMPSPLMSGRQNEQGIGNESSIQGNADSPCTLCEGFVVDTTKTAERIIAKPIGPPRKPSIDHIHHDKESTARIKEGDGKILAPSSAFLAGHNINPEVKVVEVDRKDAETRPIVYFVPPNRLVINSKRPSSKIILDADTTDPIEMKSRVLPLLVRAGIDAFPQSLQMSKQDWLTWYDKIIDSMWTK